MTEPTETTPATAAASLPLAVDLDGTLLRTDSLWESVFVLLRLAPWKLLFWPFWLLRGRAYFKHRIADHASLDAALLPYSEAVLAYVRNAVDAGRVVALVTAADQRIADGVATHLGLFGLVRGSVRRLNLRGHAKAVWLEQIYPQGFEYIGDSRVDMPVWKSAAIASIAGRDAEALKSEVQRLHPNTPVQVIPDNEPAPSPRAQLRQWLSAMRVHQWSKNLLVMVPFLMASKLMGMVDFWQVLLAVLAFSLLASATYFINDLLDLPNDRQHPTKSRRAFASCALSIKQGVAGVAALLLATAYLLLVLDNAAFTQLVLAYGAITLAYSFYFKREALLDTMVLAALYTLRICAGAAVLALPMSWWLMSFSFLFFLSLALMKRYAELQLIIDHPEAFETGRGYQLVDMPLLRGFGISASFGAVVLFLIYLILEHFSAQMFSNPRWLWPIAMLMLLWQARLWLLTNRGEMNQDPIYFALRDKVSLKLGGLCLLMIVLAW